MNKVNTAVQLVHQPSGISVRVESRKQGNNRKVARERLKQKLSKKATEAQKTKEDTIRKEQAGSGMRGDKIRTIDEKHDYASSHLNSKQTSYKAYCKGHVADLW